MKQKKIYVLIKMKYFLDKKLRPNFSSTNVLEIYTTIISFSQIQNIDLVTKYITYVQLCIMKFMTRHFQKTNKKKSNALTLFIM